MSRHVHSFSVEEMVDWVDSEPIKRERALSFVKVGTRCLFVFSAANVMTFSSLKNFWNTFNISEEISRKRIVVRYYLIE